MPLLRSSVIQQRGRLYLFLLLNNHYDHINQSDTTGTRQHSNDSKRAQVLTWIQPNRCSNRRKLTAALFPPPTKGKPLKSRACTCSSSSCEPERDVGLQDLPQCLIPEAVYERTQTLREDDETNKDGVLDMTGRNTFDVPFAVVIDHIKQRG